MPALTFVTTGLVSGDTVSANPTLTTTASNTNNAGSFVIEISGGSVRTKNGAAWTDCYDVVYQNGTLAVKNMYSVTVSASPSAGGTVTGGGTFAEGDTVSVTATANSGYRFSRWLEGSTAVSGNTTYTFMASVTRDLVAEFVQNATVTCPDGTDRG